MNRLFLVPLVAVPVVAGFLLAPAGAGPSQESRVARGRYLVSAMSCNDCHTPVQMGPAGPEPDLSRLLSGHPESLVMPPAPVLPPGPWVASVGATMTAWAGPWGVSYTANLTPDKETGLGTWDEATFFKVIKSARHLGRGREILPPMSGVIPALRGLTEEDAGAVFAYLQSIPAIRNRVPDPVPPEASAAAPGAPVAAEAPAAPASR